jgi:hypothetical protein
LPERAAEGWTYPGACINAAEDAPRWWNKAQG